MGVIFLVITIKIKSNLIKGFHLYWILYKHVLHFLLSFYKPGNNYFIAIIQ